MLEILTLTDGGQAAADIAARLTAWLGEARRSLDIALYDVRLPGAPGDAVADAIHAARGRGVAVRIAYNDDQPEGREPLPPPVRTRPDLLAALDVPLKAIPGARDLMHHKYVVRDGASVWTGSTNWTTDSWEREENFLLAADSAELAAAYGRDFEQLWSAGIIGSSGNFDTPAAAVGPAAARPWFCPGRGPELSHRIAEAIGTARRRVRIASPVLTAAPVLSTIAQVLGEGKLDIAGVVDATQVAQVQQQWGHSGVAAWKQPLLDQVVASGRFTGKRSTPYGPGTVHDYMHAKVTVADDVVFAGSFNLSRSGETNAENVLELHDAQLAERFAAFIDEVRARYPALTPRP